MTRHLVRAVLTVLLVAGVGLGSQDEKPGKATTAKKGETVKGKLMKVDPSAHRLTVHISEKKTPNDREFDTDERTKFVFFAPGGGGGKKELVGKNGYRSKDLKENARVTILTDAQGKVTEVRVGEPVK